MENFKNIYFLFEKKEEEKIKIRNVISLHEFCKKKFF